MKHAMADDEFEVKRELEEAEAARHHEDDSAAREAAAEAVLNPDGHRDREPWVNE